MPINESGYTQVIGPDPDGKFIEVAPGEEYGEVTPMPSVNDLRDAAAAEDVAAAADQDAAVAALEAADAAKAARRGKSTTGSETPANDPASTEGASE